MIVDRYTTISEASLLNRLHETRLKGFGGYEVYRTASIELLEGVKPDRLAPAQRYVLKPTLGAIRELRNAVLARGIDIFSLRGGLNIWLSNNNESASEYESIPVLPPIVEESQEPNGRVLWLINDGLHRVYSARSLRMKINIVLVRGVPAAYPYYAYANPEGWDDVVELEELPDEYQKKSYRIPGAYKSLFRDFDSLFPGIQKTRKQSNPRSLRP